MKKGPERGPFSFSGYRGRFRLKPKDLGLPLPNPPPPGAGASHRCHAPALIVAALHLIVAAFHLIVETLRHSPHRCRAPPHRSHAPSHSRIVPTLQRGNASWDAPASRFADGKRRWSVKSCVPTLERGNDSKGETGRESPWGFIRTRKSAPVAYRDRGARIVP